MSLDVRKSLSITFIAISNRYKTFFEIFDKMATGGHIKWDDDVNYRTSPRYLEPAAIFDVRNSLSNAFLAISDRYRTFFYGIFLTKPAAILDRTTMAIIELVGDIWSRRPFGMSENHFRSHL